MLSGEMMGPHLSRFHRGRWTCLRAAADTRSKNDRVQLSRAWWAEGGNVGAQMSQKPLVTVAVSEVTCGKCQHVDVAPKAMTETDG